MCELRIVSMHDDKVLFPMGKIGDVLWEKVQK